VGGVAHVLQAFRQPGWLGRFVDDFEDRLQPACSVPGLSGDDRLIQRAVRRLERPAGVDPA